MRKEFAGIVKAALEAVHYVNEQDNGRFRAAVQDLSTAYPQERKFFHRNADDRFLQICYLAGKGAFDQIEAQKNQAAQYVANEYWVQEDMAKEFAEIMTSAFYAYDKGLKFIYQGSGVPTGQCTPERKNNQMDGGGINKSYAYIQPVNHKSEQAANNQKSGSLETQKPKKGKGEIAILLTAVFLIALFIYTNRDTFFSSPYSIIAYPDVAFPDPEESVDISLDNDADIDYEMWYACNYDEELVDVEWRQDDNEHYLTITKLGEGSTEVKIYAIDKERGWRIRTIRPAYVRIYDEDDESM